MNPPVTSTVPTDSALVRKIMREPTVDLETARTFLGIHRDLSFRLAATYRRRLAKLAASGRVIDEVAVRPRCNADGEWLEIANQKIGKKLRCRSDLLLSMVYRELTER